MKDSVGRIVEGYNDYFDIFDNVDSFSSIKGSSSSDYSTQEVQWKKVAEEMGLTLEDLAAKIAAKLSSEDCEGGPGVEGLYELTKNPDLFRLTDYANVRDTDQLCFSYFYSSPERIKHWEACLKITPDLLAVSTANLINQEDTGVQVEADGNTVSFLTTAHDGVYSLNEVLLGLRKRGWDIEEVADGRRRTWIFHERNLGRAIGRIISQ